MYWVTLTTGQERSAEQRDFVPEDRSTKDVGVGGGGGSGQRNSFFLGLSRVGDLQKIRESADLAWGKVTGLTINGSIFQLG